MIKRLILAAAIGVSMAGAAWAQDAASTDDCLKQAFELAQTAEGKKLADADLEKLDGLLSKMEGHCDAKQFAEASAVSKDIKAMLTK